MFASKDTITSRRITVKPVLGHILDCHWSLNCNCRKFEYPGHPYSTIITGNAQRSLRKILLDLEVLQLNQCLNKLPYTILSLVSYLTTRSLDIRTILNNNNYRQCSVFASKDTTAFRRITVEPMLGHILDCHWSLI